jgi:hypothetical protein
MTRHLLLPLGAAGQHTLSETEAYTSRLNTSREQHPETWPARVELGRTRRWAKDHPAVHWTASTHMLLNDGLSRSRSCRGSRRPTASQQRNLASGVDSFWSGLSAMCIIHRKYLSAYLWSPWWQSSLMGASVFVDLQDVVLEDSKSWLAAHGPGEGFTIAPHQEEQLELCGPGEL